MANVLKTALIYSGIYFVFCILWTLVLIGAQVFWKPVVAFFLIVLTLLTLDHFKLEPFVKLREAFTIRINW